VLDQAEAGRVAAVDQVLDVTGVPVLVGRDLLAALPTPGGAGLDLGLEAGACCLVAPAAVPLARAVHRAASA